MSDLHKRNKNIVSNRKAFSSIVGAIFAILVIVTLAGTFFVWSIQQNSLYVDAVSNAELRALEAKSESLNITGNPTYTLVGSSVTVAVGIQNDGPVSVNVTTLWVQDTTQISKPYGFTVIPTGYFLTPGLNDTYSTEVQVLGAVSGDSFTSWLITSRGNVVPLYPAHGKGDQGVAGSNGTIGSSGTNGTNGSTWYVNVGAPSDSLGVPGDFYLRTDTVSIYNKNTLSWIFLVNLTGPAGTIGANGANGSTWYAGPGVPDPNLGVNGDFYFSNNTYCIYDKNSTWVLLANLTLLGTGGTGANGTAWHVGTSDTPPSSLGADGDFYLNTVTYNVYRKSSGAWSFLVNIKGVKGDPAQDATSSLVAQGIGSIMLDFKNVTAYNLVGPFNATLSAGVSGYNVYMGTTQSKRCIGFSVNLTNLNPDGGTIYLNSSSVFFSLMPYVKTPSQPVEAAAWYIVNVNPATRLISPTYSRIILPYNISTRVYFAAYSDLSYSPYEPSDMGTMQPPTTCPINLALIGNIVLSDGTVEPFGQNLPFVSIYVRSQP